MVCAQCMITYIYGGLSYLNLFCMFCAGAVYAKQDAFYAYLSIGMIFVSTAPIFGEKSASEHRPVGRIYFVCFVQVQ